MARSVGMAVAALAVMVLAMSPAGGSASAAAPERLTFMLDWFPNPDHVPLYAAVAEGYFSQAGLRVTLQVPANADDPLKLAAVGRVDIAVNYEPSVVIARAQGLPVKSIGVLIGQPLTTVMFLQSSGIRRPRDLAGRRVGFAVTGYEDAVVDQVVRSDGGNPKTITMVNVGFDLVPALLTHKVDAVVGAYRNVERVQIELQGQRVGMFEPERYGVPTFYELVLIARDQEIAARRPVLRRFVGAVARGLAFTEAHPEAAFRDYVRLNPTLGDTFNRRSFAATLPYYARAQTQRAETWDAFSRWMASHKVISAPVAARDLFVNLAP